MQTYKKPKIVAVVGPTASGKTDLSIRIAERFNGEIISADARQIYRGMDIGTNKVTAEERKKIPHYLIDIKDPDEEYTVANYKEDAIAVISEILNRGKLPVLTGGTGLYIKAILENLNIPNVQSNPELRAKLETEIEKKGMEAMFKKLIELDPDAAIVVDPKNPRRVVRALEVALTTGEPFTAQRKKEEPLYDTLLIGLNPPSEVLRERIDARVDRMLKDGLLEEVTQLTQKYGMEQTAFAAIGYQEIIKHLKGEASLDDAIAEIKMNTWHYAKRQMTWFKKDASVHWIANTDDAIPLVKDFLDPKK